MQNLALIVTLLLVVEVSAAITFVLATTPYEALVRAADHFNNGNALYAAKDYHSAIISYKLALENDKAHIKSWTNLGLVQM